MIGKIYISVTPYYDRATNSNRFKKRPVLIIGGPRNNDYTVLPVSTVTNSAMIDADYDICLDPAQYPLLHLNRLSYLRTHKQTSIHQGALVNMVSDMKTDYPDLFFEALEKLEVFNNSIFDTALG